MALLIMYDEHGGFYDHEPTPVSGVPNPDGIVGPDPFYFKFNRLGVRVPTLLVSPWIDKATVIHEPTGPTPSSQFEHSSIPATVKKLFNLNSNFLTKRDAWTATFENYFKLRTTPRTDCPVPRGDTPHHSSNTAAVFPSTSSGGTVLPAVHYFTKHDTVKLTESNFLLWKHQLLLILEAYNLEGFVQGTVPVPSSFISGADSQLIDNPAFLAHKKQDKFLASWLLTTISDDILIHLTTAKTSFAVWSAVEARFGVKSNIKISSIQRDLYSIKKANLTVKEYLSKIQQLSNSLIAAGHMVTEQEQISIILAGLSLEYESIRVIASATPMSIDLLTKMLLDCEARQLAVLSEVPMQANVSSCSTNPSKTTDTSNTYSQDFRTNQRGRSRGWSRGRYRGNGRGWSRFRPQCQLCGKVGHVVQTCYHRFDENFSGVESVSSKMVNYHQCNNQDLTTSCCNSHSQVSTVPQPSCSRPSVQAWYPDSGATNHITPDMTALSTASSYTGKDHVSMGNGASVSIAHVGTSSLLTGSRVLHLKNVLHVPTICKNLLSVGQFAKDNGVYFEFHPYLCFVKDIQTGMILLVGHMHDGLYRFDVSQHSHAKTSSAVPTSRSIQSEVPKSHSVQVCHV